LIELSPYDQQPKIRIYRDEADLCKGDGALCYYSQDSVKTAVEILHEGYLRPNNKLSVTQADFSHMTQAQSTSKSTQEPKKAKRATGPAISQAQLKVARSAMRQALAWNEDDDSGVNKSSALKIIVLEGLFQPTDFEDPTFEKELEEDIVSECSRCGQVEKLTVFSKNPRGIAIVKFTTAFAAEECIRLMHGRFFAGTQLKCFYWDGATNYDITKESVAEMDKEEENEKARLDEFGDWLEHEQDELPEEFRLRVEG
jgi:HIV Tat-specific factor 1